MININELSVGQEYDRKTLAYKWGYKKYHAITRGIFTPANEKIIILFITEDNQPSTSTYVNRLEGNLLFSSGEKSGVNDNRVSSASSNGDVIILFHRNMHHMPFTYKGEVDLVSITPQVGNPSRFVFHLSKPGSLSNELSERVLYNESF